MKKVCLAVWMMVLIVSCLFPDMLYATPTTTGGGATYTPIKQTFMNITANLGSVINLIQAMAAVAGLGFGVASIFKFKQHKDNPQQVTIGQPLALMGIAVMLLWLPFLLQSLGGTITGGSGDQSGRAILNNTSAAPTWLTPN